MKYITDGEESNRKEIKINKNKEFNIELETKNEEKKINEKK